MSGIIRNVLKSNIIKSVVSPLQLTTPTLSKRLFTRNIWHMCTSRNDENLVKNIQISNPSNLCSCGCGIHGMHTKSERELVEFLTEEIVTERKSQKVKKIPDNVEGFSVHCDGAEVTLTKKGEKETVNIHFNVNHTVDTDAEPEINPNMEKPEMGDLKSKPQFEVDLVRGKQTLSFTCSFLNEADHGPDDSYNDIFGIEEVTLFEGEWNDKVYAVAGDVLDGYLYDLLMNLLDEKGITNDFVEKLSEFSTAYEHSSYINLLEGLSKFTTEVSTNNDDLNPSKIYGNLKN